MRGGSDTAKRVRQVLLSQGLTLHRASERSAEAFGRQSLFYVPHNLYHSITKTSFTPNIHQLLALSHISAYRLADWLAVFGFDLDSIFALQLLVPRRETTLLNSTTYDPQAWIPWFAERTTPNAFVSVVPLAQMLRPSTPRRAAELLGHNECRFVYARIGHNDIYARPYFVPGNIVRVDTQRKEDLIPRSTSEDQGRFFLVEYDGRWTCSRIVLLDEARILLRCSQQPCAERELNLEGSARIVGVIDADLRPLPTRHAAPIRPILPMGRPKHRGNEVRLRYVLRDARIRSGLSFREASEMSRFVAKTLSDRLYFTAPGTLSDYEASDNPPRQIQKILTICILYGIDFDCFLRAAGLPLDHVGCQPMPDSIVGRRMPEHLRRRQRQDPEDLQERDGLLSNLVHGWEEVPLFLRFGLKQLTGIRKLSLSDIFCVRGSKTSNDPLLANGALVAVNRRVKKPASFEGQYECERPLYILLLRDGRYECGRYSLDGSRLSLHTHVGTEVKHLIDGVDAEIIGQVTTVLRRFA